VPFDVADWGTNALAARLAPTIPVEADREYRGELAGGRLGCRRQRRTSVGGKARHAGRPRCGWAGEWGRRCQKHRFQFGSAGHSPVAAHGASPGRSGPACAGLQRRVWPSISPGFPGRGTGSAVSAGRPGSVGGSNGVAHPAWHGRSRPRSRSGWSPNHRRRTPCCRWKPLACGCRRSGIRSAVGHFTEPGIIPGVWSPPTRKHWPPGSGIAGSVAFFEKHKAWALVSAGSGARCSIRFLRRQRDCFLRGVNLLRRRKWGSTFWTRRGPTRYPSRVCGHRVCGRGCPKPELREKLLEFVKAGVHWYFQRWQAPLAGGVPLPDQVYSGFEVRWAGQGPRRGAQRGCRRPVRSGYHRAFPVKPAERCGEDLERVSHRGLLGFPNGRGSRLWSRF